MTDRGRQNIKDTIYVVGQTLFIIIAILTFLWGYMNIRIDTVDARIKKLEQTQPNKENIELKFDFIAETLTRVEKMLENCQKKVGLM